VKKKDLVLLDRRSPPTNARKHSGDSPQNTRRAVAEDQNQARYQHATTVQVRNSDAISNALQHRGTTASVEGLVRGKVV
jgi:hypothetical protein